MSEIFILVPGEPVAKGRPRFAKRGAFVTTYTPEKTRDYELKVSCEARRSMGNRTPIQGPVALKIELHMSIPKSWSQKKRLQAFSGAIRPTSKPDWENVCKALCDALNGIAWMDDSQVVEATVSKRYAEEPCAIIRVSELDAGLPLHA